MMRMPSSCAAAAAAAAGFSLPSLSVRVYTYLGLDPWEPSLESRLIWWEDRVRPVEPLADTPPISGGALGVPGFGMFSSSPNSRASQGNVPAPVCDESLKWLRTGFYLSQESVRTSLPAIMNSYLCCIALARTLAGI